MNRRDHERICNALARVCDLLARMADNKKPKGAKGWGDAFSRRATVFRRLGEAKAWNRRVKQ